MFSEILKTQTDILPDDIILSNNIEHVEQMLFLYPVE